MKRIVHLLPGIVLLLSLASCGGRESKPGRENGEKTPPGDAAKQTTATMFTPVKGNVRIMNLAPGHFHASLVHKTMYDKVAPTVHVFAPEGPEVKDFINRIGDYNSRPEDPTSWDLEVYAGEDYLKRMLEEKPGNVMVVSGNNARKTEYILEAVTEGIHVLADKPMVISPEEFPMLEQAFKEAAVNRVLLYDIMTERYEITTILQRELSMIPGLFGTLERGSPEEPAITKESVHHFFKYVSGKPLVRPPWFFDVSQQGEGMVDVGTHLVDMIQWEAFPEVVLEKSDVEILSASRWTTDLTPEMFEKVTGLDSYPDYLGKDLEGDVLKVYSNGEINYTLRGIHAKISVIWNFQAPEGTGDTHHSVMRGTRCSLEIRQGEAEGYKPMLYIELNEGETQEAFYAELEKAVYGELAEKYPGLELKQQGAFLWKLQIPDKYKVGHEAHFAQVTEKYLDFLEKGTLPEWEIPNMIVKYYTTTRGLEKAME